MSLLSPRCLLASTIAAALYALSAAAPAQVIPATADKADPKAQELEHVVVTANRIEQPIEETPMAVTALDAKALDRLRVERFDDYLTQVPAMASISPRPGNTQLILRGISAGYQANSMVSIYVDDSPFGSSSILRVPAC